MHPEAAGDLKDVTFTPVDLGTPNDVPERPVQLDTPSQRYVEESRAKIDALMAQTGSPAQELIDKYAPTDSENQAYGDFLRAAHSGELAFDPIANAQAFAIAADQIHENGGIGDIEITLPPASTATNTEDLEPATRQQIAQQVRFAKSLGYLVHPNIRIENGSVKIRIVEPNSDTPARPPRYRNGIMVQEEPADDGQGGQIPGEVIESLQAANYLRNAQALLGERPRIARTIGEVMKAASQEDSAIRLPLQLIERGGASYYRAVAESLGYKTGPAEQTEDFGQYRVPLTGRRSGFERRTGLEAENVS